MTWGDILSSLKVNNDLLFILKKISEMFRNQFTSPVMFIFHFIIPVGKTVLKEENTMNQTLFNLHMLMSSNLKKHILKRASYVHI